MIIISMNVKGTAMATEAEFDACTVLPKRHWSMDSESYSGGDALLGALDEGWKMIKSHQVTYAARSGRPMIVYVLWLERNNQIVVMRLVANPFITRFLDADQHMAIETLQHEAKKRLMAVASF